MAKKKAAPPPSTENQHAEPSTEDEGYVVVARRYRPKDFGELVGQGHVGQALKNAIETNRVGHAYLFTGARGVGKTSTARIFAKALNNPGGASVNFDSGTEVATAIDAGQDVDVIEIDGASNRGIEEIRSLRANVGVRPSRSRYKIYIIDEVHMLTMAAFNALLKTLEEPPEHVKFIFCTTDPEKVPITVLSRCQRFDFAPVEVDEIVGRLRQIVDAEGASADNAALELIARRAAGSMRDSQSLLEQVMSFGDGQLTADSVHGILGTADEKRLGDLTSALARRDAVTAMAGLDAAIDAGIDAGRLAEQLLGYFRDVMAVAVGCDETLQRHTPPSVHGDLKQLAETWGLQTVLAAVAMIDQTLVRIRQSVYSRVLLEATLIQICNLPDLQALSEITAAASGAQAVGPNAPRSTTPQKKKPVADPPSPKPDGVADAKQEALNPPSDRNKLGDRNPSSDANKPVDHQEPVPDRLAMPPDVASDPPKVERADDGHAQTTSSVTAPIAKPAVADATPVAADAKAVVAETKRWDQRSLDASWSQIIAELPEMTAAMVRRAEKVEAGGVGDGHVLRLVFPSDSAMARRRCEASGNRQAICDAVRQVTGQTVALDFKSLNAPARAASQPEKPAAPKVSRRQKMQEIESNPLVQSVVEQFGAQITKVEHSEERR